MAEGRNARRLRGLVEMFGTGGVRAALEHVHPDIEWHAPPEWLEQRLYRGREQVEELGDFWVAQFEDYRLDVVELIEMEDDRVTALLFQRGRIKESGAEVEQEVGWLTMFEDGLLRRNDVSFTWQEALERAGLEPAEHLPSGRGAES
jgi:ketosteroid isomerase-like protein